MKKGWEIKTLGEVCEIIMGQSPNGESYNITGEGVPLINGPVEFSVNSFGKTIRSKFTTQPTKLCKKGDLILCIRGSTTGRMNISGFDACIGRGVAAIRAKQYQPWVNHFVNSMRDTFYAAGTGATFPNLSSAMLASFPIAMPPLPEQQRIVAILDEAFEGIAKAKANAEQNLKNARELFERHLQAVFSQRGEGWISKKLSDICDKITDGTHQTPTYFEKGHIFLSSRNVTSGKINWDHVKFIDDTQHQAMQKRISPKIGDILLAKNGTTGIAAIVDRNVNFDFYVSLALLRSKDIINPKLLLYFVNSPAAKLQFNKRLKGVGVQNLHLKEIREVKIFFPRSEDAQLKLIENFDALQAETQRLESIYQRKIAALDELKKSLLHKAFSGEL